MARSRVVPRTGRNAQQAVIEVEETPFRGHSKVVDAHLVDYFGSIPHAELMPIVVGYTVHRHDHAAGQAALLR
jgi:RNA-directed DNA polymerase